MNATIHIAPAAVLTNGDTVLPIQRKVRLSSPTYRDGKNSPQRLFLAPRLRHHGFDYDQRQCIFEE
jgi:hypothetical protein